MNFHHLTLLFPDWSFGITTHYFYDSFKSMTDYGSCCLIVPYLNLINPKTKNLNPSEYDNSFYHQIPRGSKNGLQVRPK